MIDLNATNDPSVGRREDIVRSRSPNAVDYQYQPIEKTKSIPSQTPRKHVAADVELRSDISRIGASKSFA